MPVAKYRFPSFILFILCFFIIQPQVSASTAQGNFDQGLKEYNKQNYERALQYFERARTKGLDDPKLYYNLGVTHYKLENYQKAESYFLLITDIDDTELQSLAYYNLGLVALKQNNKLKAEQWFRKTLSVSQSNKLNQLAGEQLRRQGFKVSFQKQMKSAWFAMINGALGYDDNVTLQANDLTLSATGQDDQFFELFAYANKQIAMIDNIAVQLDGSLYSTRYDELTTYNLDDINIGIILVNSINRWDTDTGLSHGVTYLDGQGLNRTTVLSFTGKRQISSNHKLRLRYSLGRIDELENSYSYLSGWRHQTQVDSTYKLSEKQIRLTYRFEVNDREDLQTPLFTSYSPTRHSLRARIKFPMTRKLTSSIDLRYRHSRYNDPNEQADGSFITRSDDRYRMIAKAIYQLSKNTDIIGKYIHTDNQSNIASKSYIRNQYQVGISYRW